MSLNNSSLLKLPGRRQIRIPLVTPQDPPDKTGISKSTPTWTISCDNIFSAHIENGYDPTATELFGFTYNTVRETVSNSVNQLLSSSATRFSNLNIIIQNASYSPILEQYMNSGTLINNIIIKRWGWIKSTPSILEERTFGICNIVHFQQILDYLALSIRTVERTEKTFIYNQEGGSVGQVESSTSTLTGLITSG